MDALARLDGMFALAAFDRESGQLILARDPFGEKPLYYADLPGGGFAFASELQALEAVPGINLEVSIDSIAELLMFQYVGAPRTIYSGISKLQAGHWLTMYPSQAPRTGRYFYFRPGSTGFDHRPIDQLADELEDILVRSLRRRLISDVPLGAFLSGGVDSSTICALIRRRLGVPLQTFSIGFQGAAESEHQVAKAFAEHLGTEHRDQIIAPNTSDFLLNIGRVLDEPNADSSCLPTYMLSAFARETVTVALSGDGGDEMFAGYGRYFSTLEQQRQQSGRPWSAGNAYYGSGILISTETDVKELIGFVPDGVREHLEQLRGQVNRTDVPLSCRLRQTDVENYLPGAVLAKVDRMSMQHSLEVRSPLLNVELARFAERLPQSMLYDGQRGKVLLRELAYRYLPRELIDLPKKGFGLPVSRWGQNELLQVASKLLESSDCLVAATLGRDAITRFMRKQRSAGGFVTYQVWALAMFESWLRHHPARLAQTDTTSGAGPFVEQLSSPSVQLWRIADGVLVVADANETSADQVLSVSESELMSMIAACPDAWPRIIASRQCEPLLGTAISWKALSGEQAPEAIKRAPLLLVDGSLSAIGWSELEGLRRLGVRQIAFLHPRLGDGSVTSIELRRSTPWRQRIKLLDLLRFGMAWLPLARARPERGHMRVAGALPQLATGNETERFALFEGARQLPPVPASLDEIRLSGNGRYAASAGQLCFSSTDNSSRRPGLMWMVRRTPRTERRLQYLSTLVPPVPYERCSSLMAELKAALQGGAGTRTHAPLRRGDTVIVLTHALPPGGAERQWCYLAGELKRMGYNVEFVTLWELEGENQHYLPLLTEQGVPLTQLARRQADERETLSLVYSALKRIVSGDPGIPIEHVFGLHLRDLAELFRRLKPRAVFAQLDYCNLLAAAAGVLAAVPQTVLSFRNYNPSRFSYLSKDWFQPLYALLVRSPSVLLTGNSDAANLDYAQWIGIDASRIELVPNAIDVDAPTTRQPRPLAELRRELGIAEDTPVILGVFRLSEEKRPILFVETFAAVLAQVPDARALIAGVGPFEASLRQRIDELKLGESLTLLGRRDDIPQLMEISSLLLLTSCFEGMPNVVLEAQAAGLAVVAPNVGGV
ncbi:MAG TPA: asparagine synthase (glutamine-hydrolyzing), partial [Burkholderiaceae bacterium]|nr:asparagine synthase (glutamine-hydrolyzing) [Burkholderiaceae bacterium]